MERLLHLLINPKVIDHTQYTVTFFWVIKSSLFSSSKSNVLFDSEICHIMKEENGLWIPFWHVCFACIVTPLDFSGVWIRDGYSSNDVCVFQEWCRTLRSLQMERGRSPWAGGALETRWALRNPWGSAVPPPLELLLWRKLATTSGRKHQVRVHLQHSWTLLAYSLLCLFTYSNLKHICLMMFYFSQIAFYFDLFPQMNVLHSFS